MSQNHTIYKFNITTFQIMAYQKSGTQDPKVGPGTQDP